jgi:hypothetical protein
MLHERWPIGSRDSKKRGSGVCMNVDAHEN